MKRPSRLFLLACCALLAAGCASGYSKREVLDAGSQVEIRSYQTRSYDTTDKIRVLRSVMATLQDLGFVIDKADDVVGVVSATKLNGYAMSMTVSVRANGEQIVVRANAQYGLKAIEQPGPYQDFFNALDKGLFLDRNMLADDLPTQNLAAGTTAAAASPPQPAAVAVGAGSVFDYYGEAEEEIKAQSYDKDLWARALVAAEGDEQKRKARYIELRAEQLFAASGAAASAPSRAVQRSSSITPAANSRPQTSASVAKPAAASSSFSDDLSGTWVAEISTNREKVFKNIGPTIEFTLEQNGNRISGINREYNLKIGGTRNGDEIEFWVEPHRMNYYQNQEGRWKISPDRANLTGNWKITNMTANGQWTMTRVGARAAAGSAREQQGGRLTGTYYSKMTGSYKRSNAGSFYIEQNGDQITGYSEGKGWEIEGKVSGSTVNYKWYGHSNKGKGKFSIDEYGNLSGDYHGDSWGQGEWRLTRIN
jgi:hypothetical protein